MLSAFLLTTDGKSPVVMRPLPNSLFFLFAMNLCGCATLPNPATSENASQYRQRIVGTAKPIILRCAGVPDKTFTEGSLTFFSYSYRKRESKGGSFGYQGKQSIGISGYSESEVDCVATLEFDGSRVTNVSYRAPPSGPADLCSAILAPCFTGEFAIGPEARPEVAAKPAEMRVVSSSAPPGRPVSASSPEKLYANMRNAFSAGPEKLREFAYDIYLVEAGQIEQFILRSKGKSDSVKRAFILQTSLPLEEAAAIKWFMQVFSSYRVY